MMNGRVFLTGVCTVCEKRLGCVRLPGCQRGMDRGRREPLGHLYVTLEPKAEAVEPE